jgi:hypothetical protein
MADQVVKKERKKREPGEFVILVAAGQNEDGEETFVLKGRSIGTSKRNAVSKAAISGDIDLKIGDEVAAVSARQFVPKPISLSV